MERFQTAQAVLTAQQTSHMTVRTVRGASPMTETTSPVPLTLAARVDQVFPTLTPAQIARIAAHGHVRQVQRWRGARRGG